MDDWEPDFLTANDETEVCAAAPRRAAACALVVEDDPEVAHRCSKALDRLGIHAEVVWTREQAIEVLTRTSTPLAFAFVDGLRDGSAADLAAEAHRIRPLTPLVVASGSLADVLTADGVVICKPFTAEQFRAAFDAALFDGETSEALREAAEIVRNTPLPPEEAVA